MPPDEDVSTSSGPSDPWSAMTAWLSDRVEIVWMANATGKAMADTKTNDKTSFLVRLRPDRERACVVIIADTPSSVQRVVSRCARESARSPGR